MVTICKWIPKFIYWWAVCYYRLLLFQPICRNYLAPRVYGLGSCYECIFSWKRLLCSCVGKICISATTSTCTSFNTPISVLQHHALAEERTIVLGQSGVIRLPSIPVISGLLHCSLIQVSTWGQYCGIPLMWCVQPDDCCISLAVVVVKHVLPRWPCHLLVCEFLYSN